MKKYVIISSNGNSDYEWYVKLVTWAWAQFGWTAICLRPFPQETYREETITQCIRLYAAADTSRFEDDDLIMTSDADMIPLSDYWHPDPDKITSFGWDLTNYQHAPICYIAMSAKKWRQVMSIHLFTVKEAMMRDLEVSNASSAFKDAWWVVDQDIITERLNQLPVEKVVRGIEPRSFLPKGRMDRADLNFWPSTLIDFHGPRNPEQHIDKIKEVILKAFGRLPDFL